MKTNFADHFSTQSSIYAQARPTYPTALFDYISSLCNSHQTAWDCGTGNGQCANSLANYFTEVIATDPSPSQLANAILHPKIIYTEAAAEHAPMIADNSVQLVTVATALHWFDTALFYAEVDRVLQPNGILAVWSYWGNKINEPLDKLLYAFAYEFLLPYWPNGAKKNWIVQYSDVQLPFTTIDTPSFQAKHNWNLHQMINYMNSWSAVNEYIKQHGSNPILHIEKELHNLWGDAETLRECTWDLKLLVSRK